jgi:replicative DNA helicase
MSTIDLAHQFDRLPPSAIDAEMCLLGSMMLDKSVIPSVLQLVNRESFYQADHQIIFDVLVGLFKRESPIDAIIIRHELMKRQLLDEIGGTAYLGQILSAVPSASHAAHYAKIVREKAVLRGVIGAANDALREAYGPTGDTSSAKIVQSALNNIATLAGETKGATEHGDLEWRPFPLDALPPVMADFAREVARSPAPRSATPRSPG